ncbi:MAG: type I-E CRISPR-associated protein Cse1/CasA [Thiolinea sp.]
MKLVNRHLCRISDLAAGEPKEVAALFIEAPGGKTIKDNQDHFIKRGVINQLCPVNAALALFTLQINAPSGGVGHRVSLRGGGPLTTLVLPPADTTFDTLWHRLWLNVFTQEEMQDFRGNTGLDELSNIFPWMAETRTSDPKKKGQETFPQNAHPLQMYWSMPRRIRLELDDHAGQCDLTGESCEQTVSHFRAQNYGTNYSGNWVHPLTPYSFEPGKESLSIKAQPGGLGYRHWLGLVVKDHTGKIHRDPALIVETYQEKRREWLQDAGFEGLQWEPRLWSFGYDMDNMKARCWYESTMPIFNLQDEQELDDIQHYAQLMVLAATDTAKTLKSSLKMAWFKRPKDAKGDLSFIDSNFWAATEIPFFDCLRNLLDATRNDDFEAKEKHLAQWRSKLKAAAHDLFDRYALNSLNEDGDYKKVIKAKHGKGGLEHYLNGSKALKNLVAS